MHRTKPRRRTGSILVVPDPRHHHLFGMPILAQLASDHVLATAYEWLCQRRRDYSPNADVWALRRCWPCEKEQIKRELLSGNYRFSLLTRITLKDGEDTDLWSARDALVLKALAIVLGKHLPVSRSCRFRVGGGLAGTAAEGLPQGQFRRIGPVRGASSIPPEAEILLRYTMKAPTGRSCP